MFRVFNAIGLLILLSLSLEIQALPDVPLPPRAFVSQPPTGKSVLPQPPACNREASKSPILVLSIDGAAVRGIAQFELLIAIEDKVNESLAKRALEAYNALPQAQRKGPFTYKRLSITDIFDFFAGTSAGSVNVGALLIPKDYTLSNTIGYVNEPKFTLTELKQKLPDTLKAAFDSSLLRDIRTLQIPGIGGLLGSKFSATKFESMLQEYAGKARVSDFIRPAVITSYDWRKREAMNFSTYDACSVKSGGDVIKYQPDDNKDFYRKEKNVYIWEAIRASSAAPVFYKPLELMIGGVMRALIDAGLFVMSPTLLAWVEVQKIYPGRPLTIISISSGTLNEDRVVEAKGATAGSVPKVLQPTLETALEGQQALTDLMMRDIINIVYHRLSFEVKSKQFDDTSPENIKKLEDAAKVTIRSVEFALAIEDIVKAIEERKRKMVLNPYDFAPFICQAKQEFREKIGITPIPPHKAAAVAAKSIKEDLAKQKIQAAFEDISASGKQKCLGLLGERNTQSSDWKNGNCDKLLTPKVICSRMLEQSGYTSTQWNKNCNKKLIKPKMCKDLDRQMKWDAKEFSSRSCQSVGN